LVVIPQGSAFVVAVVFAVAFAVAFLAANLEKATLSESRMENPLLPSCCTQQKLSSERSLIARGTVKEPAVCS